MLKLCMLTKMSKVLGTSPVAATTDAPQYFCFLLWHCYGFESEATRDGTRGFRSGREKDVEGLLTMVGEGCVTTMDQRKKRRKIRKRNRWI